MRTDGSLGNLDADHSCGDYSLSTEVPAELNLSGELCEMGLGGET